MDSGTLLVGDLILVRGNLANLGHLAIRIGESIEDHVPLADTICHVAIFMGNGMVAEAQSGRISGYNTLDYYAGNYDIGHVALTPQQRLQVTDAALAQFGRRYDWLLILDIAVDILFGRWLPYHERKARICSTFANDAYFAAGVKMTDKVYPTPEDLALSSLVTIERVS